MDAATSDAGAAPAQDAATPPPRDASLVVEAGPAIMTMPDAGPVRSFHDPSMNFTPPSTSCEAEALLVHGGAFDEAWAVAVAADSLLVAGTIGRSNGTTEEAHAVWRVERRALADLTPVDGFGSGGLVERDVPDRMSIARTVAADSEYVYTAGLDWAQEDVVTLHVDKRSLATGALAAEFELDSPPTATSMLAPVAQGLVVDGGFLYVTGTTFAIEKRSASDGSLVEEFGDSGVSQSSAAPDSVAQALAVRDGVVYVAGSEGLAGLRIEARNAASGDLLYEVAQDPIDMGCGRQGVMALTATDDALYLAGAVAGKWHVERRRRSDGQLIYAKELPLSGNCEFAFGLAVDDTGLYVAGTNANHWRIEKRALADGQLVEAFGEAGAIESPEMFPNGSAHALAVHEGVLYAAGSGMQRRWTTLGDWRIERRSAADGSMIECPSWAPDAPAAPACASTPTLASAADPAGAGCAVRVATSKPCAGINVRATATATEDEDWNVHYANSDLEDWGLASFGSSALEPSSYLVMRGFGFDLPGDARVLGIQLDVTRDVFTADAIADLAVRVIKDNQFLEADRALSEAWGAGVTEATHGGPDDLWDATWTAAEINDRGFGVALRVRPLIEGGGGQIDDARVRVYYCE